MKYKNTMLVVSDMDKSKQFYREVMNLHVILDFGANVTLTSGICLQTLETWKDFIHKDNEDIHLMNHGCELYFETENIEDILGKLNQYNVALLHGIKEHRWGQRVIRFYDPDGHIIEVGESLRRVAKKFLSQGLSHEEIAKRMDVPLSLVRKMING